MAKILFFTILVIAIATASTQDAQRSDYLVKVNSSSLISVGPNNDLQIYGFSIREFFFYFVRSGVKGYIAGYEGRYTIPEECLDNDFQIHVGEKTWDVLSYTVTFWKHSTDEILNKLILLVVTVADEIMNDCGDGKILIDLFQLFTRTGTIGKFVLALFLHSLYTAPFLLVWGAIAVVFNTIFCYYVGGYAVGQFLNALVLGNAYPWD
uniref:Uncharacterized protein n=1 Tax=Euplotes harpa TaxID=151035 RepID=A0A7S3N4H5_9SPIT|mmetsp:Transcript_10394/g.11644  ORF Transcript_10394/g.11644 Transcript_10394/m.11644 type:complete len:208 (+) Transcript_10394:14-637(+)